MQTKFLFIDAETDGLYGSFLTVGLVVTDDAGNMIEKAYYGIKKENMMISDVLSLIHISAPTRLGMIS